MSLDEYNKVQELFINIDLSRNTLESNKIGGWYKLSRFKVPFVNQHSIAVKMLD